MAASRTRSQYRSGILTFYDDQQNYEVVRPMAPLIFYDDFLGKGLQSTELWNVTVVGAGPPTVTQAVNIANGIVRCALQATSEVQLAPVYWGDQLLLSSSLGLVGEFIFGFSTAQSAANAIAYIGFASAKNNNPDSIAESAWFRFGSSGVVSVETDNGTTDSGPIATSTTLTANNLVVGRIDMSDLTSVKFFINGVQVATGTTFNMNAGTKLFQPFIANSKQTGTDVGTLDLDQVQTWSRRS